ncbi:MAG: hypothetical protein HQM09_18035 [Candidatus Riflebacteria bacterium]|nr:hypothetical protein [Candidatus Riflebacteria bacterium]
MELSRWETATHLRKAQKQNRDARGHNRKVIATHLPGIEEKFWAVKELNRLGIAIRSLQKDEISLIWATRRSSGGKRWPPRVLRKTQNPQRLYSIPGNAGGVCPPVGGGLVERDVLSTPVFMGRLNSEGFLKFVLKRGLDARSRDGRFFDSNSPLGR